jgi:hypothetical protein
VIALVQNADLDVYKSAELPNIQMECKNKKYRENHIGREATCPLPFEERFVSICQQSIYSSPSGLVPRGASP